MSLAERQITSCDAVGISMLKQSTMMLQISLDDRTFRWAFAVEDAIIDGLRV